MQQTTIVAEMAVGTCLVERVTAFEDFTALVLGFRRDGECLRLTWHPTPPEREPPVAGARLAAVADRLASDPGFVAGHVTGPTLIQELGVDTLTAAQARLCRMPRNGGEMRQIAERFGLAVDALAALIGKREA